MSTTEEVSGAPSWSRTNMRGVEGRYRSSRPGQDGAGDGTRTHGVYLGKVVQLPLCDTRELVAHLRNARRPSDYQSDARTTVLVSSCMVGTPGLDPG